MPALSERFVLKTRTPAPWFGLIATPQVNILPRRLTSHRSAEKSPRTLRGLKRQSTRSRRDGQSVIARIGSRRDQHELPFFRALLGGLLGALAA